MASACLEEALKNARYNESVVVTAVGQGFDNSNGDESNKEIILVPVIDTNNGGVSWQDAASHSQTESLDVGILRHFRTKKWILPMLNDLHRNNLYETSIREACSTLVKKQNEKAMKGHYKDGDVLNVLDIGSGTGLLAMISSKYLKEVTNKEVKIVSIEMASAMARIANQTIAENGLQDSIKIIEGHSCDPSVCPYDTSPRAVMCTSELLETGLLGEGIIPALRDAWDRHLAEDAIVVPQRARVYAQVLQGGLIHSFRGPHHNSARTFQLSVGNDQHPLLGGNGIGIRLPFHADVIFADTSSDFLLGKCPADETDAGNIQTLSDPHLVLDFDFTSNISFHHHQVVRLNLKY
jgi:Predicted RNA methylase